MSALLRAASRPPVTLARHVMAPTAGAAAGAHHRDRTPVVFIHGLLGSSTNFRTIQSRAARTRPTVAVDLVNHGRSPHVPHARATGSGMRLEDLAADVAAAAADAAADVGAGPGTPVDVVGHSLGGKTAMVLALLAPSLVRRLVVVDIAPVAYDPGASRQWRDVAAIVHAAHALRPEAFTSRADIDKALAAAVADPGVRSFVAQNLVPGAGAGGGGYSWRINTGAIVEALPGFAAFPAGLPPRPRPGAGGAPPGASAHFVAGERSEYLAPATHAHAAALFPGASFVTVPGAGHWVHADKPAAFWDVLAGILDLEPGWP